MQFFSAWFKAMVVIATLISIVLARPISSANLTPSRTTNLIDRAAQPDPITQSTSTSTAGTYGDTNYAGAYASNEGSNSASGAICDATRCYSGSYASSEAGTSFSGSKADDSGTTSFSTSYPSSDSSAKASPSPQPSKPKASKAPKAKGS